MPIIIIPTHTTLTPRESEIEAWFFKICQGSGIAPTTPCPASSREEAVRVLKKAGWPAPNVGADCHAW